ncbi:hypothetical protein HDU93_002448 [Gonapodya sp. JEL0774]|nr:hypothetical protein HDU93_002448 [Gonapodya sp. JEL0774]
MTSLARYSPRARAMSSYYFALAVRTVRSDPDKTPDCHPNDARLTEAGSKKSPDTSSITLSSGGGVRDEPLEMGGIFAHSDEDIPMELVDETEIEKDMHDKE